MGYTTDFVGHVDITPPLNPAEYEYLTAFSQTRRWDRAGGPYVVPGNPRARESYDDIDRYNRPAPGQPQLWCQWVPCGDGDCLAFDGHEKFYAPLEWMRYLIDHFLRPGAVAASLDAPQFADFTFDHVLDGVIVGCRRDTRELYTIEVRANEVAKGVLRPADPPSWFEQLPYEQSTDRFRADRTRRRRNRNLPETAPDVVDLAARRSGA